MLIDGTSATAPVLARTILMTADATGGILAYAIALASELVRTGTKVHVALMGPKPRPEQEAAIRSISGVVLHRGEFALEWMDEPWNDVARATEWLRDLERQIRPDIIHLNGYAHGAAGFDAPIVIVAHSCLLARWEALGGGAIPDRYARYKQSVKRGLDRAAAVIAVSQSMRVDLERHYGPLPRLAVVPSGLGVAPTEQRKEPVVVSAGRLWDRAKNVEQLARIARDVPWPVKLAGGPAPSGISDAVDLGELEGVEHLGWLPPAQLGALLDGAAIFAAPARYQPFGMAALEAGLRGCALVLGDLPSQRELWGDAALLVEPGNEEALRRGLLDLIGSDARREALAAAASVRARLYTTARNARVMRDLYETIVQARRIPVPVLRGHPAKSL